MLGKDGLPPVAIKTWGASKVSFPSTDILWASMNEAVPVNVVTPNLSK